MKLSELLALDYDDQIQFLARAFKLPEHYAEKFIDTAEGCGLTMRQAIGALRYATSIAGDDLDSWIYSGDMESYAELVVPE